MGLTEAKIMAFGEVLTMEEAAKYLKELKEVYDEAVFKGEKSLMFKDSSVLTNFAKYMIEYLEQHLK
jgi:hypothetical protein